MAITSCTQSPFTAVTVTVKDCLPTGLNEENNKIDSSLYPNPNSGEFRIAFSSLNDNCRVEIYNSLGQLVYNAKLKTGVISVNMKNLAKGVYVVKLLEKDKVLKQEKVILE